MSESRRSVFLAIERLRDLRFPPAPVDDELSNLHAELADYDGYVAGYLTRLQAGDLQELPGGLIDQQLGAALRSAVAKGGPEGAAVNMLLTYYEGLIAALRLAGST